MPYKDIWKIKYSNIKNRAKERGIPFDLSFEDYRNLAKNVGIEDASQIGRRAGNFHLARYGDSGGYCIGNCRFVDRAVNDLEAKSNGCYDNISKLRSGKTKETDAGRMSCSQKLSKVWLVISPEGTEMTITNLRQFCKDNGLDQGNMSRVCSGKQRSYKKWRGKQLDVR